MSIINYNSKLKNEARKLRNNPTNSEKEMWIFLKVNYPDFKFLRQKPLDNFIPDFYCVKLSLIIEVDGDIHLLQKERDVERDNIFFQKYKIKTIRFTNTDVLDHKDYLKKTMDDFLHSCIVSPFT
jgi:leucyl-tRNA synthetase